MPEPTEVIRQAQVGEALGDLYPPSMPRPPAPPAPAEPAVRSRGGPPAGRAAAPPASAAPPARRRRRRAPRLPRLTAEERDQVVATFVTLIEGLYAHLPLKRAMYGTDPVQRLRLLGQRSPALDDAAFHAELADILTDLRDAHTRYSGPTALAGYAATLPFAVEAFGPVDRRRYIVANVATDPTLVGDPSFVPGVELRWWNGVPVDRAVEVHAERETGGRPDSRRARALESLTTRALQYGPPPDEHWVDVGYLDEDGAEREVRVDWRVVRPRQARTAGDRTGPGAWARAIDPGAEVARRVRKLLFAPEDWLADQQRRPAARSRSRAPGTTAAMPGVWLETSFPDVVAATVLDTPSGRIGYLRLWSFNVDADEPFVAEVVRLLGLLPQTGLVIDLRANPGGLIWAAERLLQLFTPRTVAPTRFSLLASPLTRAMALAPQNEIALGPWRQSLLDAVATGEAYSQAVPMTPVERCNDLGQVYGGPVVAVVDANTYSAGDLFAAGFVDNELGLLVTVGEATGAGGANVWDTERVEEALAGSDHAPAPLPAGIGYTISVRRATRAGAFDGLTIEDVGVRGHRRYDMTRRDLVAGNADLIASCARLLADQPRSGLWVEPAGEAALSVTGEGLDRLDVFVDGRPHGWWPLAGEPVGVELPAGWTTAEVAGYRDDRLLQRRRVARP
ncbi:MAG TPA: S41 family peptidase [Acidimicrobiales bacterium]|nr:S41 family peptidase [Acidimicrobiales bacterium]